MGDQRRRLQLQQQQDALNLDLQQSMRARRHDLGTADARRLDRLHMQQRLQRQQLEHQQLQADRLNRRDAAALPPPAIDTRIAAQDRQFALERQLQMQQFDLEQQQLLNAAPRRSLQSPPASGQLDLP